MKKWITLLAALLMIAGLSTPALAAEEALSLSDATGQEGGTVYLAVSFNEAVQGNTVGITYTYDASVLEALPESCSWSIKGLMKDFDYNNAGVWASANTQELSGNLCVLAFKIKTPLASGTEVSCTVIVKDGAAEVGSYTAQATVTTSCGHEYAGWSDSGTIGHTRACTLCGASQTQSHSWDEGVVSDNPQNSHTQLKTFTCTVCGAAKSTEITKEQESQIPQYTAPLPTFPQETEPTEPSRPESTRPTLSDNEEQTRPTEPVSKPSDETARPNNGNSTGSQNLPTTGSQSEENFHVHADGSIHYGDHEETPVTLSTEDLHDHTHETQSVVSAKTRYTNAALSVVIVCLMFAAGAWYLKKKKH